MPPPRRGNRGRFALGLEGLGLFLALLVSAPAIAATRAPDFTITDIEGQILTLGNLGGQVVLLDFMDPLCSHCENVTDGLKELVESHTTEFLAISIDYALDPSSPDTVQSLQLWKTGEGVTWHVALDNDSLATKYDVHSIPKVVIIDPCGNIAWEWDSTMSAFDKATLEQELSVARSTSCAAPETNVWVIPFIAGVSLGVILALIIVFLLRRKKRAEETEQ